MISCVGSEQGWSCLYSGKPDEYVSYKKNVDEKNAVQIELMRRKPQKYMPDVREMVRIQPHSKRWKDCERERATAVWGTVLYVKAMMAGVMLIVVRVMRFAPEPVGEILQSESKDCSHH